MNRMRAWRIGLLSMLTSCTPAVQHQDKPIEFAPGQVWHSNGVAGEPAVYFVVLETSDLPDVGPVVCIRMSGLEGTVPEDTEALVERMHIGVYPVSILRRHANALSTTLPRELFPRFDFASWQRLAKPSGEVSVQTLAPSVIAQRTREWAKEFRILESKLPAYLPKDQGQQRVRGPRITVAVVIVDRGEVDALESKGRRVEYLVGGERCADLDAMKQRLQDWTKRQQDEPTVIVEPRESATYGDVAPVVDAVLETGIQNIRFGDGMGTRGRSRQPGSKPVEKRPQTADLAAGQVWQYQVPDGEKARTLTVLHIEDVDGHGKVAFVELPGLAAEVDADPASGIDAKWLPFWARTLVRHLDKRVDTAEVTADRARLRKWREDFPRGLAGYSTGSPWGAVLAHRAFQSAAQQADLEDLILPKAIHVDEKKNKR